MSERDHSPVRSFLRKATDPIYDFKRWTRPYVAAAWRHALRQTQFVGITGSHGKTTTTVLLAEMLATIGPSHAGAGWNIPEDIARKILRTRPWQYRFFVQEISGHAPGKIEISTNMLQPSVGIVTAISGDHRQSFAGSWEATAAEKAKLVHGLTVDGLAVLNADDPLVAAMAEGCRCKLVTFGAAESADLRVFDVRSNWPDRLTFEAAYRGERFVVKSRLVGVHWTLSVSAALLAALEIGADRNACLRVIENFEPVLSRNSVHPAPNGAWYIIDAEKASFSGIKACLGFLDNAAAPRRTVIFGTLADYPGDTRSKYHQIGRMALDRADRVIFTGPQAQRARRLREQFPGRLLVIDSPEDVLSMLRDDAIGDEIIYVKASRGDRFRQVFLPGTTLPAEWKG